MQDPISSVIQIIIYQVNIIIYTYNSVYSILLYSIVIKTSILIIHKFSYNVLYNINKTKGEKLSIFWDCFNDYFTVL